MDLGERGRERDQEREDDGRECKKLQISLVALVVAQLLHALRRFYVRMCVFVLKLIRKVNGNNNNNTHINQNVN